MSERIGNLGYVGFVKEATKGVPLTPTDFVPLYDESIDTLGNFVDQQPIYGGKFKTFKTLPGQRSHKGDITILAEPNTTARFLDIFLTKLSTSGAGPYTHTFGLSSATDPNSATIDVSTGNVVTRVWGVQASKMAPVWNKNEMQWKISISGLGSFRTREIATVATTTLTLKDPNGSFNGAPNKGLVIGDLVRIYKPSTGATLDTTVATVNVDGITVTLAASAAAFAAGDQISLRPTTPAMTLLDSFLWAKTEFRFAATAASALSATQLRLEQGSTFELTHEFNSDDGEPRSGGFDPASLIRKTGDASLDIKKYFDTFEDVNSFQNLTANACVIRHFVGQPVAGVYPYELRVTFNQLITDGTVVPNLKADDVEYSDIKYHTNYNQTDGVAFGVAVINNLATI